MNLYHPFALAGAAFVLAAAFWLLLFRGQRRGPAAAGRLDALQVIFLLSLLALLVLVMLTWNDRAIAMPLLGSLLGSIITGLPLLRSAGKEKADLKTVGDQCPSVRSGGKVTITYRGKLSSGKKAGVGDGTTQGNQCPAVEAKKDVEIKYDNTPEK